MALYHIIIFLCFFYLYACKTFLDNISDSSYLFGMTKKLCSSIIIPPSENSVMIGVIFDRVDDSFHREWEHMIEWVIFLSDCHHQADHASIIRFLEPSRVHQE